MGRHVLVGLGLVATVVAVTVAAQSVVHADSDSHTVRTKPYRIAAPHRPRVASPARVSAVSLSAAPSRVEWAEPPTKDTASQETESAADGSAGFARPGVTAVVVAEVGDAPPELSSPVVRARFASLLERYVREGGAQE